jgi:hypothetical protein
MDAFRRELELQEQDKRELKVYRRRVQELLLDMKF